MPQDVRVHPVYRAINKPLTIWGAERRLFFLALIMRGVTFNFFGSLLSGLAMFVGLSLAASWVSTRASDRTRATPCWTSCATHALRCTRSS